MNRRVFVSMLVLSVVFLVACYVLKIFFPQQFVLAIENENIIKVAKFIDKYKALYYVFGGITAFITYWLYCCACSNRLYLNWYECLEIFAVVVATRVTNMFDTNLATAISTCAFMFLPALTKGKLKNCAIVFTIHGVNQCLTLTIRGLITYARFLGALNIFLLSIDMYLWLLLCYVVCNYSKNKED